MTTEPGTANATNRTAHEDPVRILLPAHGQANRRLPLLWGQAHRHVPFTLARGEVITGHIDILQIRYGMIHILDYKPAAKKIRLMCNYRAEYGIMPI